MNLVFLSAFSLNARLMHVIFSDWQKLVSKMFSYIKLFSHFCHLWWLHQLFLTELVLLLQNPQPYKLILEQDKYQKLYSICLLVILKICILQFLIFFDIFGEWEKEQKVVSSVKKLMMFYIDVGTVREGLGFSFVRIV